MATHPTGRHLFYCATVYLQDKYQQNFYSVHRLDRETSGTLILSKNADTSTVLTDAFEYKQVEKAYFFIAIKDKKVEKFPFIAKERIGQEKWAPNVDLFIYHYPENSSEGKSAETRFEKIWEDETYLIGLAFTESNLIEPFQRQGNAGPPRHRDNVDNGIGRPTHGHMDRDGILDRLGC